MASTESVVEGVELLLESHEPAEFGRIMQVMLELTLRDLGWETRGRRVERPDIIARRGSELLALEVKAESGIDVHITRRDLEGVLEAVSGGGMGILALLAVNLTVEWIFADASRLRAGRVVKGAVKAQSLEVLETEINSKFPEVLNKNLSLATARGSSGLYELL